MTNQKKDIDIVNDILEACILAYPVSSFIISLYKQYMQRGSLSKKQLEGLHSKATQIESLSPGKLATLEAMIKKMPTRYKSELPELMPGIEKEEVLNELMSKILNKYPLHKRVLFLKAKYDNNEILRPEEIADLKRFEQLLK